MAFRLDKLTVKSQEAVQRAQTLASEKGHPEMDPLHLLSALLDEQEGVARPILEKIGVNVPQLAGAGQASTSFPPSSHKDAPNDAACEEVRIRTTR